MKKTIFTFSLIISSLGANSLNSQMQSYMNNLKIEAKNNNPDFINFNYTRGEKIFTSTHIGKRGTKISCVSCHNNNLTTNGENINTGKAITPLSPIANQERFTKVKTVKKWLRRNFRDVYKRVGTAQEKGDVITYIINKN